MGRVARYKKVKSFDPFSKQNKGKIVLDNVGVWGMGDNGRKPKKRSLTSQKLRQQRQNKRSKRGGKNDNPGMPSDDGFDLPPTEGDDFDLADILGSTKKKKLKSNDELLGSSKDFDHSRVVITNPTDQDTKDRQEARILRLNEQIKKEEKKTKKKSGQGASLKRLKGESAKQFARRVQLEMNQSLEQTNQPVTNEERKSRKKEFLKAKKKRKKNNGEASNVYDKSFDGEINDNKNDDNDDNINMGRSTGHDQFITGERAIAMADEPMFGEQAERPPVFKQLPRGAKKTGSAAASNSAMEVLKRKIEAQYALVKQRRKQAGEFHL